MHENVISA